MHDQPAHAFEFVPAPADLAPYLNSLYILRIGPSGLEEVLPAYSGQLLISDGPFGRLDFGQGFVDSTPNATIIGPLSHACPLAIDGPATILGASLNFLGWAALTRLPATQYGDRFMDVATGLGKVAQDAALQLSSELQYGKIDRHKALDRVADILRPCIKPLPDLHRLVVETAYDWVSSSFNPPSAALYDRLPLSKRQVERLVSRFFGLPPVRLKRRFRAIRAATFLSDPDLHSELRDEILNSFYDQAHMIREIRQFVGRTPRMLREDRDSLTRASFRPDSYEIVDVFAGEEAEQLADCKK